MPLTVLARMIGRSVWTPYGGARQFGLRNYVDAEVRHLLTRPAAHMQTRAAVRETVLRNLGRLEDLAGRAVNRHQVGHSLRYRPLVARDLAHLLDVQVRPFDSFLGVWRQHLHSMAQAILDAGRHGCLDLVTWQVAERYIDLVVFPRPRMLAAYHASPDFRPPAWPCHGPVNTGDWGLDPMPGARTDHDESWAAQDLVPTEQDVRESACRHGCTAPWFAI